MNASRILSFLGLLASLSPLTAQDDDFSSWQQSRQESFADFSNQIQQQYDDYAQAQIQAFRAFVEEVEAVWGSGNVWVPSQVEWVRYSEDLANRTKVDFRSGDVRLQWLFPPSLSDQQKEARITASLQQLLLTGTTDPLERFRRQSDPQSSPPPSYSVKKGDSLWKISRQFNLSVSQLARFNKIDPENPITPGQILLLPDSSSSPQKADREPSSQPLLQNQVLVNGLRLNTANASTIAQKLLQRFRTSRQQGHDHKDQVTFSFPMAPDHLKVRRQRALPHARNYADELNVPLTLVLAIMEVESAFNPRARSYIPAFGLMQLVPASGARDAYRFLYNQDRMVGADYLYNPANNTRLGTAYLHLLLNRYFKNVSNPMSRLWCAVAAYNTGPGNVARALTGSTALKAVPPAIQTLSSDQVYLTLRRKLPYAETRSYVVKVHDTLQKYQAAAN